MAGLPEDRMAVFRARFRARAAEDRDRLAALPQDSGGREQAIEIVHRLRGSAGSMGFPQISEAAATCERALLADTGAALAAIPEFAEFLAALDALDTGN